MNKRALRTDPSTIRATIANALPQEGSGHGQPPEARYLYVPQRHAQAVSPDHGLVVGIRGAGKSVWWAALQSAEHRRVVAASIPGQSVEADWEVDAGFGEAPAMDHYPDKGSLKKLLDTVSQPANVWRTVMALHTPLGREKLGAMPWSKRVGWTEENPEKTATFLERYDTELFRDGRKHLVLFDALDRSADDWDSLRKLLRGLLEVLLEFRAYRCIRAKVFVRPDMLRSKEVTAFRDSSKVVAGKVELRWTRADLYGLLFQHLGNEPTSGKAFRTLCEDAVTERWVTKHTIWAVPKSLRDDESAQRAVFELLAGQWMGRDRRRGFPYTWLPSHLADAEEQVSPRSFLAAIRTAAANSSASMECPLHYDGIKKGVQEASRIRVNEVTEDFPWVQTLMEPLRGMVIPCDFDEVDERWREADVIGKLAQQSEGLRPEHLPEEIPGLRKELTELGIFREQSGDRINMPDVYRVGFGLGRKGGVKPIR